MVERQLPALQSRIGRPAIRACKKRGRSAAFSATRKEERKNEKGEKIKFM